MTQQLHSKWAKAWQTTANSCESEMVPSFTLLVPGSSGMHHRASHRLASRLDNTQLKALLHWSGRGQQTGAKGCLRARAPRCAKIPCSFKLSGTKTPNWDLFVSSVHGAGVRAIETRKLSAQARCQEVATGPSLLTRSKPAKWELKGQKPSPFSDFNPQHSSTNDELMPTFVQNTKHVENVSMKVLKPPCNTRKTCREHCLLTCGFQGGGSTPAFDLVEAISAASARGHDTIGCNPAPTRRVSEVIEWTDRETGKPMNVCVFYYIVDFTSFFF